MSITYELGNYDTYPKRTFKERVTWFGFKASLFGKIAHEQNLTIALSEEQNIDDPLQAVKNEVLEKFDFTKVIFKKIAIMGAVLIALIFSIILLIRGKK